MGLEKTNIDSIGRILELIMKSFNIFSNYVLENRNIQKLNSPTKVTNYNFSFISKIYNREIYIRISDYYKHQNLLVWIRNISANNLSEKIDLELYFLGRLSNNNIKQKMIFKAKSEIELGKDIESIFEFIVNNSDEKLKGIFEGKIWIDTPFDWGDYKWWNVVVNTAGDDLLSFVNKSLIQKLDDIANVWKTKYPVQEMLEGRSFFEEVMGQYRYLKPSSARL